MTPSPGGSEAATPTTERLREAVARTYFGPPETIDQGQARLAALVRETGLTWAQVNILKAYTMPGTFPAHPADVYAAILEAAGVPREPDHG